MSNYDRFLMTYTGELWKEIQIARSDNPSFYTWAQSQDNVLEYCSGICEGIRYGKRQRFNLFRNTTAGRRTCRMLGIEPTQQQIRKFLLGDLMDDLAKKTK